MNEPSPTAAFATVDHDRARRCGVGEVIFAAGKTPDEVVAITAELREHGQGCVLITRANPRHVAAVEMAFRKEDVPIELGSRGGTIMVGEAARVGTIPIPIVTAGTSDLAVAEEAAMTCRALGYEPRPINDVGVAGVHRLMSRVEEIKLGGALIVIAGMEGALPSVVGGLVDVPVIAVPTSVGYGASFGGLAALLGMLNSCASGVTVVNIDNGFGAAFAACQINRLIERAAEARDTQGTQRDAKEADSAANH